MISKMVNVKWYGDIEDRIQREREREREEERPIEDFLTVIGEAKLK